MFMITDLIRIADAYRDSAGVERESTVSHRVFGDTKKLTHLRAGRADITLGRFWAAVQWFDENWPEGAARPADLDRWIAQGRPEGDPDLATGAAA